MSKELAKSENLPVAVDDGSFSMLMDKTKFEHLFRVANMFSKSTLVPEHYRNKPENCMIMVSAAMRMGVDILTFLQKSYVIQGKPGIEAQLVIALVNKRGPFNGPIDWEFSGEKGKDSWACTAFATHAVTGKRCEATVTWKMVQLEGWSKKSGSKWLTMPEQMFRYRSATFLARLYCPEVLLGFQTNEELLDVYQPVDQSGAPVSVLEDKLSRPVESVTVEDAPESPVIDDEAVAYETPDEPAFEEPAPAGGKTQEVFQECRFICDDCSYEHDEFARVMKGQKPTAWKCPKCLSTNVIDRRPEEGWELGDRK